MDPETENMVKLHIGMSLRIFKGDSTLFCVNYRDTAMQRPVYLTSHRDVVFCITLADFTGPKEALQGKSAPVILPQLQVLHHYCDPGQVSQPKARGS